MKKTRFTALAILMGACASAALQSCDDNDSYEIIDIRQPTAVVTVCPQQDGTFVMRLDDHTTLVPTNMQTSPYGDKEVRAFVNYVNTVASSKSVTDDAILHVRVNWLDSIRTKLTVFSLGQEADDATYGTDPIEIVNDWVTVAEDGYITMRIRTLWGDPKKRHYINLLSGVNPDNPMEFELRHNASGDTGGTMGDAIVAFNLNTLHNGFTSGDPVKIKLRWKSFSGEKSSEFNLMMRPHDYMQ